MSYILSKQRNSDNYSNIFWEEYQTYLESVRNKFPKSTFEIAVSDWWYSFEDPRGPHDAGLILFELSDKWAKSEEDDQYCSLTIKLASAHRGTIVLKYPKLKTYRLKMPKDSSGMHGDWLYDEFSLSKDNNIVHTIEWANGPGWVIEANDLIYEYNED